MRTDRPTLTFVRDIDAWVGLLAGHLIRWVNAPTNGRAPRHGDDTASSRERFAGARRALTVALGRPVAMQTFNHALADLGEPVSEEQLHQELRRGIERAETEAGRGLLPTSLAQEPFGRLAQATAAALTHAETDQSLPARLDAVLAQGWLREASGRELSTVSAFASRATRTYLFTLATAALFDLPVGEFAAILNAAQAREEADSRWHRGGHQVTDGPEWACAACAMPASGDPADDERVRHLIDPLVLLGSEVRSLLWLLTARRSLPDAATACLALRAGTSITEAIHGWQECLRPGDRLGEQTALARWQAQLGTLADLRGERPGALAGAAQ